MRHGDSMADINQLQLMFNIDFGLTFTFRHLPTSLKANEEGWPRPAKQAKFPAAVTELTGTLRERET